MVSRGLNANRFTLSDSSEPNLRKIRSNKDHKVFDSRSTEATNHKPKAGVQDTSLQAKEIIEPRTKSGGNMWPTLMLRRLSNCHRLTFLITLPLIISYIIGKHFPSVHMPQSLIGMLCTPMGIICSCALPDLFAPLSAINCNADYYHNLCSGREVGLSLPISNSMGVTHLVPSITTLPSSTATTTAVTTMMQMVHEPNVTPLKETDVMLHEANVDVEELALVVEPIFSYPAPHHRLPDFGLAEGGAKVLSGLTSPTEGIRPLSYFAGLMAILRGYDKTQMHINPPLVVFEEQLSVSNCWKFTGSQGHIAVSLSDTINWTHFTFHFPDHLDPSNIRLRQAPKTLIMRALVQKADVEVEDFSVLTAWESFVTVNQLLDSSLFNSSSAFLEVARVFYMPSKGGRQTFSTQIPVQTSVVLIEILDNWGDTSTCIHRISVHGHK
ncbi:hypothetical protein EV360DRAFT_85748 [Lentinula raphanica]|nr:hypothetical protein EV360DRAFT_85748 [Lentinula raphanica]